MNDGHAVVTELLGAWALDACSAEEAVTVEDHLAGCPSCAAEADRLGRAVAGLATTVAVAPPARLRGAILAAAAASRPTTGEEASTGYAAWVDRFDAQLQRLTPAQWRERVIHDWTVQDLVAHLIATDELLVAQLGSAEDETPDDPAELDGGLAARRTAATIGEHRGQPPGAPGRGGGPRPTACSVTPGSRAPSTGRCAWPTRACPGSRCGPRSSSACSRPGSTPTTSARDWAAHPPRPRSGTSRSSSRSACTCCPPPCDWPARTGRPAAPAWSSSVPPVATGPSRRPSSPPQ